MKSTIVVILALMALAVVGPAFASMEFCQSRIGTIAVIQDHDAALMATYRTEGWVFDFLKLVGQCSEKEEVIHIPSGAKIAVVEDRGSIFKGVIKSSSKEIWLQTKDFIQITEEVFEQ